MAEIFDPRVCELGEGPLWHPLRQQLFWFDILNGTLLTQGRDGPGQWRFPEMVSAAGWVAEDVLLIAGERDLFLFDLETEEIEPLVELEAKNPKNRSNDGRADRQGGFWIGTMAKNPGDRRGAGAIYRYYRGELRCLFPGISIPNAICFAPDGGRAYFGDSMAQKIWSVALDGAGWPQGEPRLFLDLTGSALFPDGAVIDAEGNLWNAQWGGGRVAQYAPDGRLLQSVAVPAPHSSCPAFAGPGLDHLICTSALEEMTDDARAAWPLSGQTFVMPGAGRGLAEPRVIL